MRRSWLIIFIFATGIATAQEAGRGGFFFLDPLPELQITRYRLDSATIIKTAASIARTPRLCSGIILEGGRYVTARHCHPDLDKPINFVQSVDTQGHIRRIEVRPTDFSTHIYPYDLSIYHIETPFNGGVKLRPSDPIKGEVVFGIGFPWEGKRSNRLAKSPPEWDVPRITFGNVVFANEEHKSICKFSNNVEEALPETWKFQADCTDTNRDNLGYDAREENDLFLTDSDMTYGMSGSPPKSNLSKVYQQPNAFQS